MKLFDGFHQVHFEAIKIEKFRGKGFLSEEFSGKGSTQKIYYFNNGYGASVINGFMSFGHDELAVLGFENIINRRSKKKRHLKKQYKQLGNFNILYNTPVSDDVKRYNNKAELVQDLNLIATFKAGQF